ncbi:MAG: DNA polymerase III subunit gamma/tau, partial [Clostridia bacterium]|nr:DNA polymerase III subunit gamma/tau [Clostridia bacterium]
MYRALYRKWRPRDFDEVCGQTQVTDILKYQVAQNKVSHAYLFCGSRGTGKTSCAKILAKAVNCLSPIDGNPCHACEACLSIENGTSMDVIEMDAASNNGVDNVRDMKEELSFTPAGLRYRVYIIDEVHMMSGSAFNALLKTLEEPPAHVLFVLATTELQKLPSTIISRCQRFDFRRLSSRTIADRLLHIAKHEDIELQENAAQAIARAAQGGMRDAISLFELCASGGREVTAESVTELLGTGNRESVAQTVSAIFDRDFSKIYSIIDEVVMCGLDVGVFWQSLGEYYRDLMVVKVLKDAQSYLDLTDTEYSALKALSEKIPLSALTAHVGIIEQAAQQMQRPGISKRLTAELTLTRLCEPRLCEDVASLCSRVEQLEKDLLALRHTSQVQDASPKAMPKKQPVQAEPAAPAPKEAPVAAPPKGGEAVRGWRDVVDKFESIKPAYKGVLRGALALISQDGALSVTLKKDFLSGLLSRDELSGR